MKLRFFAGLLAAALCLLDATAGLADVPPINLEETVAATPDGDFSFDRPSRDGGPLRELKFGAGIKFSGDIMLAAATRIQVANECPTVIALQTTGTWKLPSAQPSYVVALERREVDSDGHEAWRRIGAQEVKVGANAVRTSWTVQERGVYRGVIAARKKVSRINPIPLHVEGALTQTPKSRTCK